MTPWCYTPFFEGTDDFLKEHSLEIFKKVDVDGDEKISFTEFVFFMVLYQLPKGRLRKIMKRRFADGKMTKEQASETLREMRKSTPAGKRMKEKAALDARQIKASDEDFWETNKALV